MTPAAKAETSCPLGPGDHTWEDHDDRIRALEARVERLQRDYSTALRDFEEMKAHAEAAEDTCIRFSQENADLKAKLAEAEKEIEANCTTEECRAYALLEARRAQADTSRGKRPPTRVASTPSDEASE